MSLPNPEKLFFRLSKKKFEMCLGTQKYIEIQKASLPKYFLLQLFYKFKLQKDETTLKQKRVAKIIQMNFFE